MTVRSHPWSSSQRWVSVGIAFLAPLLFVSCLALVLQTRVEEMKAFWGVG